MMGHIPLPAGLQVIRAIEMSSEYEGEDVHILGFYIDPVEAGLQEYCRSFKQRRLSRALEIVDKCISLGYEIDKKGHSCDSWKRAAP
jgi:predicted metal-dependent phosphoesterase TrpH